MVSEGAENISWYLPVYFLRPHYNSRFTAGNITKVNFCKVNLLQVINVNSAFSACQCFGFGVLWWFRCLPKDSLVRPWAKCGLWPQRPWGQHFAALLRPTVLKILSLWFAIFWSFAKQLLVQTWQIPWNNMKTINMFLLACTLTLFDCRSILHYVLQRIIWPKLYHLPCVIAIWEPHFLLIIKISVAKCHVLELK